MSFKEYYENAFKNDCKKTEWAAKSNFKYLLLQRLNVTEPIFYTWIKGKYPSQLQQDEISRITGLPPSKLFPK